MAKLLVTFFYLEEEKDKKEIDQDGSRLDHGQQQPESKQVMAKLLVTFFTWRKRRSRKRLTWMEAGWIMVRSSQRVKARNELLVTFYIWRKRRSRKRLTRMELGWRMVRSSQRVNR
jgi:hypothetical protein